MDFFRAGLGVLVLSGCGQAPAVVSGIPSLGGGSHNIANIEVVTIATADADRLMRPRDLAFNPEVPGQLWIVNEDRGVIIVNDTGLPTQTSSRDRGRGGEHFLPMPASLAFGAPGFLATAHETDEITQPETPEDFMGPTLWTSDTSEFNAGHASHYDMLHNSPNAVGIAWDTANAYFVYDGYHQSITRYDFGAHHGPGGEDHSDGIIVRYVEGEVGYLENVNAHMEMDHATGLLYIADPANRRVVVLDTSTGTRGRTITPNYDGAEMYRMDGASLVTLIDATAFEMSRPSGLALRNGVLYIADAENSRLAAFNLQGSLIDWIDLSSVAPPGSLAGIELDSAGRIYLCERESGRILRLAAAGAAP